MKKTLSIILGTAAAALAFSSCNKQDLSPIPSNDGVKISFKAQIDEATKTTLNPSTYEVAWEDGDVMYVITAEGPWGTPYSEDNSTNSIKDFTYNAGTGLFSSEATIAPGTYTFWAMYDGAKTQKTYCRQNQVNTKIKEIQTQDCTAPTAHIKTNDYLLGKCTATIESASTPSLNLDMTHTGVLMEVNFTNNTGAPVEITKMEFILESGDLAGIFDVDLSTTPISTSTKTSYGSSITLNVTGGTVADGAKLPLYFVMAPIAGYTGNVTFRFTDSASKTYTQKKEFTTPLTFTANSYNRANLAFNEADAAIVPTSATYTKVTSLSGITAGTYIIVSAGRYCVSSESASNCPAATLLPEGCLADDTITMDTANPNMEFIFSGTFPSTVTIKNADGKYLVNGSDKNNGTRVNSTNNTWAISDYPDVAGAFSMLCKSRYLGVYNAADFRSYTSYNHANYGDGGKIYLYKKN